MTTETDDLDDDLTEEGCGYEYDHKLDEGDLVDGIRTQTCRECGAEFVTDEESPDAP